MIVALFNIFVCGVLVCTICVDPCRAGWGYSLLALNAASALANLWCAGALS